jgi:hypothetical protein
MKFAAEGYPFLRYDLRMPPYWKKQRRSNAPEIIVFTLFVIAAFVWVAMELGQ